MMVQRWWQQCLRSLPALYLLLVIVPVLGSYGLWFDEIFSVVMSRSLDSIVQMVRTQENNMLLHYLLLWLWQPLGDGSEVFLRSSSVLLVLLSLWPLYAAVQRLAGGAAAAAASLFYASHYLVLQAAMASRGYSLALLASALVMWRWAVAWQSARHRDWLLCGALAGLAVWSHYFAALLPAVLVFAMLWRDGWRQPWRGLATALLAFVAVALPMVLTRPPDGAAQIGWAEVPDWRSITGTLSMLAGADGPNETDVLKALSLVLLVVALWHWRQRPGLQPWRSVPVGVALGLLLVVLAVLLESLVGQPLFVYRFFTPLVPLLALVAGAAFALCAPLWRMLMLATLLLLSLYETWKPFVVEPVPLRYWWKPLARQLCLQLQPDDVILVYPAFLAMPLAYYLDDCDPQHALPRPAEYASAPYRQGGGVEPAPDWQLLQQLSAQGGRIWLIADEKPIPAWTRLNRIHAPQLRVQLQQQRALAAEQRYSTMTIQRFDRLPAATE